MEEVTAQRRPERCDGGQGGEGGLMLMGADRAPQLSPSVNIFSLELTSSDRPRDMFGLEACHPSVQQPSQPLSVPSLSRAWV